MADSDGLENRCPRKGTVGSNPTLSAIQKLLDQERSGALLIRIRGRALCNRNLRTRPDPEGSNGKEALLCAAGSPGPRLATHPLQCKL